MNLTKLIVFGSCLIWVGCASSPSSKRGIASALNFPAECAVQVNHVIQSVNSTVSADNQLLGAQAACQSGVPLIQATHANGKAVYFTLPPSGQTVNAGYLVMQQGQGTSVQSQTISFPATSAAESGGYRRLVFNNFTIDYRFNPSNLAALRDICQNLNRPITVGTSPTEGTCNQNFLARSPIAKFSHNGNPLNPNMTYSCRGVEPRYEISVAASGVVEKLEFGASNGTVDSNIVFSRTRGGTGRQDRSSTSSVSANHQKDVFADNRLSITARGQNFLIEFDPEMLRRHQQWCAVASQTINIVEAPAEHTEAPVNSDVSEDPVILQ